MTSSGGSSPSSSGVAPGVPDAERCGVNEPIQCPRISPPKNFICFVCGKSYNERDYHRHIDNFVNKAQRAMQGVIKCKKGSCPGIMHISHPILRRFAGTLEQRVQSMSADLGSLCHGGALDALSPQGSGRHVDVNARVQYLMSDHD